MVSDLLFWSLAAAVDGSGHVHAVGATEGRGDGVYYVTNASGDWTTQQITTPARRGTDTTPILEIDANGVLTITFARWFFYEYCGFGCNHNRNRFDQRYAMDNAAGTWSEPAPLGLEDLDAYSSEFIGRGGHHHAAYTMDSGDEASNIMYATDESGAWVSELVAQGFWPHLALDASGAPRILFNRSNYESYLAIRESGAWQVTRVPMGADLTDTWATSLLIDSRGRSLVVFSCIDAEGGYRTYVLSGSEEGWSEPALLAADWIYDEAQLGPGDRVSVIYGTWETDGLWYASLADGVNTKTRIGTSRRLADDGPRAAQVLVVDSRGVPHLLFATPYDEMEALMSAVGPVAS